MTSDSFYLTQSLYKMIWINRSEIESLRWNYNYSLVGAGVVVANKKKHKKYVNIRYLRQSFFSYTNVYVDNETMFY